MDQVAGASQPGLYCKDELICLTEWALSLSTGSCLCRRPLDLPVGANRSGNLNSFVTQRNAIHEFFFVLEKKKKILS